MHGFNPRSCLYFILSFGFHLFIYFLKCLQVTVTVTVKFAKLSTFTDFGGNSLQLPHVSVFLFLNIYLKCNHNLEAERIYTFFKDEQGEKKRRCRKELFLFLNLFSIL